MIFFNLFLTFFLISALFINYKFWPQRKINSLFIVFVISLIPIISIFREGSYQSGDLSLHVYRLISFFLSLQSGNIFPDWADLLNGNYGYPLFIFIQPLPYYLSSFFHFIGFSFLNSIKIILALGYIVSGISIYLWSRNNFSNRTSFVISIFYLFAPYHLVDLHFRANPAEGLIFAFMPLALLSIDKLYEKNSFIWIIVLSSVIGLLILSHPISLIFIVLILFYILYIYFRKINNYFLLYSFLGLIMGLCISSFYWLPIFFEKVNTQNFYSKIDFRPGWEYFFSPWRFGLLFQGPHGELSFLVGYTHWIAIIWGTITLVHKNKVKEHAKLFFWTVIFWLTFALLFDFSKFIWDYFFVLKGLQFSYRLIVIEVLASSIIAGMVFSRLNNKFFYTICFLTIILTILNWANRKTLPELNDRQLIANIHNSTYQGEGFQPAAPKWLMEESLWFKDKPKKRIEILKGRADIKIISRNSNKHVYSINAKSKILLKENTLYYPHWMIFANKEKIYPDLNLSLKQNKIIFELPKGKYVLHLVFKPSYIMIISRNLSFLTLLIILFGFLLFIKNRLLFKP